MNRREFLVSATAIPLAAAAKPEPIIDIHQHTHYHERSDADLIRHQRGMGVTRTILLPAGSQYGLAAECGSNDTTLALAKAHPKEFVTFANELPDIPETRSVLTRYLRAGAIGIGEQKFPVDIDSPAIDLVCSIAREFRVPVLLHFETGAYNTNFRNLEQMLKRYPDVVFIGHAQTWWLNISDGADQSVLYPKGPVRKGGLTDRLLSDYPNIYGDMSAGSGLNALQRDEDHARGFLERHRTRLLYGSDCNDSQPGTDKCSGSQQIAMIRRLASPSTQRRLLYENAAELFKLH